MDETRKQILSLDSNYSILWSKSIPESVWLSVHASLHFPVSQSLSLSLMTVIILPPWSLNKDTELMHGSSTFNLQHACTKHFRIQSLSKQSWGWSVTDACFEDSRIRSIALSRILLQWSENSKHILTHAAKPFSRIFFFSKNSNLCLSNREWCFIFNTS